jgi:hypothetical protein
VPNNRVDYPADLFHQSVVRAIVASNETPARLGHLWSAENDANPRTNEQRIRRLVDALPIQVTDLISLMDALGYDVEISNRRQEIYPAQIL